MDEQSRELWGTLRGGMEARAWEQDLVGWNRTIREAWFLLEGGADYILDQLERRPGWIPDAARVFLPEDIFDSAFRKWCESVGDCFSLKKLYKTVPWLEGSEDGRIIRFQDLELSLVWNWVRHLDMNLLNANDLSLIKEVAHVWRRKTENPHRIQWAHGVIPLPWTMLSTPPADPLPEEPRRQLRWAEGPEPGSLMGLPEEERELEPEEMVERDHSWQMLLEGELFVCWPHLKRVVVHSNTMRGGRAFDGYIHPPSFNLSQMVHWDALASDKSPFDARFGVESIWREAGTPPSALRLDVLSFHDLPRLSDYDLLAYVLKRALFPRHEGWATFAGWEKTCIDMRVCTSRAITR